MERQPDESLDDAAAPYVDACVQRGDLPAKESLSEEAGLREFLHDLRAQRNARLARDGMVFAGVTALLGAVITFGTSATHDAGAAMAREEAPLVTSEVTTSRAPATATPSPAVDGALRTEDVTRAVQSERREIERCFAHHDGESTPGTVTIAFLVGERGSVLGVADVGSAASDRGVVRCVAQTMRSLTLPAPRDGGRAVVRYSFDPPR